MHSIPIIKWLFFAVLKSVGLLVGLLLGVLVRYRSWLWRFLTFGTNFFFFSPLKVLMVKATLNLTMVSFSFRVHFIPWWLAMAILIAMH